MIPARWVSCLAISVLIVMAAAGCGTPAAVIPSPTPMPIFTPTPANTAAATPSPTPTATTVPTALPTATPTPGMSAEARAYLDQALDLMQQHSINRTKVDWTELRRAAHSQAANALTPPDTYPGIREEQGHVGAIATGVAGLAVGAALGAGYRFAKKLGSEPKSPPEGGDKGVTP